MAGVAVSASGAHSIGANTYMPQRRRLHGEIDPAGERNSEGC